MTPRERNTVRICLVILAISIALMVVNMVIEIISNGWKLVSTMNIVPFLGIAFVMLVILKANKKKDDK